MSVTAPEWLTHRGGSLLPSKDGHAYAVYVGGEPQYLVLPTPAGGKYACRVTQTVNGRRLDAQGVHPTPEDAVRAGLEGLRQALGW